MIIYQIEAKTIPQEWEWLGPLLEPAIDHAPNFTMHEVRMKLRLGSMTAWKLRGRGYVGVVVTRCEMKTRPAREVCYLLFAAGQIDGGPKQVRETMRRLMAAIEGAAKSGGSDEMCIEGRRAWGKVLPDYEELWNDGQRVLLRKGL